MKLRLKDENLLIFVLAAWTVLGSLEAAVPEVDSVTPQCGSTNGGTRITVYGKNFARNFFNFGAGNEDLGSKVRMSALKSFDCEIHPDGSHETQIMCYTMAMPVGEYDIKVSVDGEDVPEDNYCSDESKCKFTVSEDCTPTIHTLKPTSGMPGEFLEMVGNIITTKYGSNEPDEFEEKILRVYYGGQKCELRDEENDAMYGITLDGDQGYLKCKTEGTYIGNHEVSFLVSNEYGRSMPDGRTQHVRSNGIAMYQSFTEITGLSQNQGSTAGGTRLTLSGQHFDETDAPVRVLVGETECSVVDPISDGEIVCDTPADASSGVSHFSGNRGFYVYMVNGTTDPSSIDKNTAETEHVDQSKWTATNWGSHAIQMVGYFVPIYSGSYKFCIKAADTATVYISTDHDPSNKVQVLQGSGNNCNTESSVISLTAGNKYYTEIHYGSSSAESFVSLVAHLMETDLTEEDTGMAEHEIQDIKFSSTVTEEIQKIKISYSGSPSSTVQDVQTVTISGNPDAYFALGLDTVYTVPMQLKAITEATVKAELEKLPSVSFDILVELQTSGSDIVLVITSDSSQGSISSYAGRVVGGSENDLTFSVQRTTTGTAKLTTFSLTMGGAPTAPISVEASANEVKTALEELFSVRCHPQISSGSFLVDFESSESWMTGRVSDDEPFCGRFSAKNPRFIYHKGFEEDDSGLPVSSTNNRVLCLAYKGLGQVRSVKVSFAYKNIDDDDDSSNIFFVVANDAPEEWNYHCENIYDLMNDKIIGTGMRVESVQAFREDSSEDLFIDQVMFSREAIIEDAVKDGINFMRMDQTQPSGSFIDSVSVSGTYPEYEIKISPHHCGYDLPLFEVASASKSSSTYTVSNGGSVQVEITRVQSASPPIQGSYSVTFNDDTTPDFIDVTEEVEADNLIGGLESMSVGFVDVEASGICSAFTFRVKMLSLTGNQPLMEIDDSRLTGTSVSVVVDTVTDGGVWFDPIMGDLLRTYHNSAQVIAFINNVPTRCQDDSVCDFAWSSGNTPSISNISPSSGSMGDVVTITGSGFDGSILSNNQVVIGTTDCTVTGATSTAIMCTIQNGPTGAADVKVTIVGQGLASGTVQFTYVTGVTTFNSSPGSVEGGTVLTISGFGFTSDAVVEVGGNECTIITNKESEITCRTPRADSHTTTQVVDVNVIQAGTPNKAGDFTYNPSLTYTPVITSLSALTSPVWGGDSLTIDGQGFGSVEMPVKLGGVDLVVDSYSDTRIVATLPALSHGSYRIVVDVQNLGYADLRTNDIQNIEYTFKVTSMTPTFGSLYGGTDLLITGTGFPLNVSLIEVTVGSHTCDITTSSSTEIECRIVDTGINHHISATGTHKNYGVGYAWDKDPHTVSVGDYVTWNWETPHYVSDIVYGVHQTETPSDVRNKVGGFSSGAMSRIGSYTYRFTVPGTYYYWTGYMDSGNAIFFRGTINVVNLESHSEVLSVAQLGHEAQYDTAGSAQTSTPACSSVTDQLSGCSDSISLSSEPEKFNFQFLKCYSPVIDSISETNGTFTDVITFSGNGFGDTNCQNEITFSGAECTTATSSPSSIAFRIASSDSPPIGVMHEFTTRVANLGYALVAVSGDSGRRFGLMPHVSSITPFEGSKVGGTTVTIAGAGFEGGVDDITVDFNYLSCDVESVTYTEIICKTECGTSASSCQVGAMTATVAVPVGSSYVLADCQDPNCKFLTSEDKTATVTQVSPSTVSAASTQLTIDGTKFGTSAADLVVKIGGEDCSVTGSVTDTQFTCTVGRVPVGENNVDVYVANNGKAATAVTVTSQKVASISKPSESSTNGGALLVVNGNGFVDGDTTVDVDGSNCTVEAVSFSQVSCTLPAHAAGSVTVTITSNSINYDALTLTYSSAATPSVTSTNPTEGKSGDSIVISGSKFTSPAGSDPTVKIGGVDCSVTLASASSITCTVGTQATGQFEVEVFVAEMGISNTDVMFTYEIGAFTISPDTGSTAGGQVVTLTGSGFSENDTAVTICGVACTEVSVSASSYVCKTPSHAAGACDIVATVKSVSHTESSAYTYDASLVSTVTSVSPTRGGTGGGTLITITGTNFGTVKGDISVEIAGSTCTVQSVDDTEITCRTGTATSAVTNVEVQRNGWGLAEQISATFEYIDLWSSPYTWGGLSPPAEGEFVVIPAGQRILLDNDTAILKMLLIQGGELIFDEASTELQAENILITDGGLLQAGTEDNPFPKQHKAIITMHGHLRSKELPIYGTKTLAVREGTLNLYGSPVSMTWTRLASTSAAGSKILNLEHAVDWQKGDEIVIATTGDRHSQKESELRTIDSITGNQITLTEALEYEHIGIQGTFGSQTVHFRAEVGLFTRNVMVRGNRNSAFDTVIEACPAGFDTGEFATQTCFQGRFGEELGSDQFGAQIMIHQVEKDTQVAQAHLQYVELKHSGQAFRMGRYPIHFHLNGNMDKSFVRGCSIHTSFNRAVNVHGSHNTMVEHNVIYNVMGGSFFLEDGDETGNTFQYNLAVFVRSSTSLRNDDITPAAFWATNPNNSIIHNAVAGGTHFATWYRMHSHPEGPGYDPNICPQAVPLGEYRNNSAHSLGWFGLWIFETYVPRAGASCDSSADHEVAKFYSLTAWNCEKGAEAVNSGALQFRDFVLVNNEKAGYEGKLLVESPPLFDEVNGAGIFDSLIVAHYDSNLRGGATAGGVIIPYQPGFMVKGIEFHNFDQSGKAAFKWTRIDGTCGIFCGGFTTHTEALTFVNSPKKVKFDWESEGVILDLDGTLTNDPGYRVAACTPSFDNTQCTKHSEMSVNIDGCVCTDQIKLIRFAFNQILPKSMEGKDALFATEFGTSNSPFAFKRITHKEGWSMVLMANHYYNFTFENADHVTNISYDSVMYGFDTGDFIGFTQFADQKPDRFMLDGSTNMNMSETMLSGTDVEHGDWYYSVPDLSITYAVRRESRKKRAVYMSDMDLKIDARMYRCFYRGCVPPPEPMDVFEEPTHKEYWSDPATWVNFTADGLEPSAMDNLTIPKDKWIIVDKPIPKLSKVIIEGGLQIMENASMNVELEADYIHITGRLVAGWSEDAPFRGQLVIRLRGNHGSPVFPHVSGPTPGAKFIGAFGGLQLHGEDPGITKTKLASTVSSGNQITVKDAVSWRAGQEILITSTSYNAWDNEIFKIDSISGKVITLNDTIKNKHIVHSETINGQDINLGAVVALLTRNIRIEGEEYPDMIEESFGARVLVGQTFYNGDQHSGFAQVSNVEFYHAGQEGFKENYDSRFPLTFMDTTSTPGEIRYSYVKKSTFHNCFSTAIGVYAVDGLEIDDNTVHHTVGAGIRTEGTATRITNNLVTLSIWSGAYLDRSEAMNIEFEGAIDGILATDLVLINNTVAGSERLGYRLGGQPCTTSDAELWSGNTAVGGMIGVGIFPADTAADASCVTYNGFTVWKNLEFGFYYNNEVSPIFKNNIIVENGIGIFPMIVGPEPLGGGFEFKYIEINDNIVIGKTSTFSESEDVIDSSDMNIQLSSQARGHGSSSPCGKIGLEMATFTGGTNKAPEKPFLGIMSYQTLMGVNKLNNNVFAHFGSCTGGRDHAIATNKNNDDGIHPMHIQNTILENVEMTSKVLFHRPNVGKINSADCVDFDCDGLKKCMIRDLDGTFLGHVGTVLPDSAYQWDGDRRHGLGDYRIPSVMLTTSTGQKIDVNSYAPNKGIYKTDNCTWVEEWQAFSCEDFYQWRMLTIESMDADTETRRLSPVAIYHPEGYVDLINGPQDHGWCSGYTCRKRMSTFQAIIALDQPFDIFLSSTNPKKMRFFLLNSNPDECVRLGMYYLTTNRIEVEVDDVVVMPTNGYTDSNGRFRLRTQNTNNQYMPDVSSKNNGENFLSRAEQMMFWVLCGGSPKVTVNMRDVFIVSFTLPAMSEEEFFGEKIVENLAAFLNMDPKKVRVVNIVADTSSSGKRKRSTGTVTFYIEIADAPGETPTVDYSTVGKKVCNQAQLYTFDDIINATVLYVGIQEPGTPSANSGVMVTLQKTGQLVMDTHIVGDVQEGQELSVQPKFKVTDENGDVVSYLGSYSSDWVIEASIKSGGSSRSKLLGNTSVMFEDGWANFTNLAITSRGDYILEFNITSPAEATNYSLEAHPITIIGRNVGPHAELVTSNRLTGFPIELDVSLLDKDTNTMISDIEWANLTWTATASIYNSDFYTGTLAGTTTVSFDPSTGKATFLNLQLDTPGKCPLLVTITSDPADYTVKMVVHVDVMTSAQSNLVVEESHTLEMKFDMDYDLDRAPFWTAKVRNRYSQNPDLRITGDGHHKGSFVVSFDIEASADGYNDTLTAMCSEIENGTTFTFDNTTAVMLGYLTVDGVAYYGVSCGPVSEDDDSLDTVYIIIIVILCIIIAALVGVILLYKFYFHPKAKTSDSASGFLRQNMRRDLLQDTLSKEDTFTSLKSRASTPSSMPPIGTAMLSQDAFSLRIQTPGREGRIDSPTPRVITPQPTPTVRRAAELEKPKFSQPEWNH